MCAEEALYLAAALPLLHDVSVVLFDTGMRPEECHCLRWENINWQGGRNWRTTNYERQNESGAARSSTKSSGSRGVRESLGTGRETSRELGVASRHKS